jgi:type IV secretory pathway VirB2 component (pilin)
MKLLLLSVLHVLAAAGVYAQDLLPAGMQSLAEGIKEVITGDFVKIILVIIFCGSAIAYAFNKDNEKIKRNCIVVAVGVALLMGASAIIDAVWSASAG